MEKRLAQPGFWLSVTLVIVVLALQTVMAVPLAAIDLIFEHALHLNPPDLVRQPLMLAYINIVAIGGAIGLGLYLNRLPLPRAFRFGPNTASQVVGVAVTILGCAVILSEIDNLVRWILPVPSWMLELFQDLFFPEGKWFSRVLLLVIVAPVTEELLFRGVILRGLLGRFRPATAVFLTAVLFGILHLNPWQFVSATLLGIAFGWFYLRTGSVGLCVIAHGIANGLFVLCSSLPIRIQGLSGIPEPGRTEFQPWWLDLAGLLVLLAGIWWFRRSAPTETAAADPA